MPVAPPSFSIAPPSQSTTPGVDTGPYTITLEGPFLFGAWSGSQAFTLDDGGAGGTFTPASVTINGPAFSITFVYENPSPGTYTLTVTPGAGPLSGFAAKTVLAVVGTGTLSTFNVQPSGEVSAPGVACPPFTITLTDNAGNPIVAPGGGQIFLLSDGGAGGTFPGGSSVTIAAGISSATFQYLNAAPGVYLLGVAPSTGPLSALSPATVTVAVQRTTTMPASAPLARQGSVFGKSYVEFKNASPGDTPLAIVKKYGWKRTTGTQKLKGPEQRTPLGVGISEVTAVIDIETGYIKLEHIALLEGASIVAVPATVAPVAAIVPTPGAGTTTFAAGDVAVAYSYVTADGIETAMGALVSVTLTSGQQISIASLTPPSGASINYYVSSQAYASSGAALAAPVYFAGNGGGGVTIIAAPGNTMKPGRTIATYASTDRRKAVMDVTDEAVLTDVHFMTPGANYGDTAGADMENIWHNCLCTDFECEIQSDMWATFKMTLDAYGDNTGSTGLLGAVYAA